jgi:hypothetical protein
MNKRKIIQRIISLPFIACLLLIPLVILYYKWMKNYFLYGGEVIAYEDKNENKSINELYFLMKDNLKKDDNHELKI